MVEKWQESFQPPGYVPHGKECYRLKHQLFVAFLKLISPQMRPHLIVLLQLRSNLWFDVLISQNVFKFLVNFLLDLRMFRQVIQTPCHHYKTEKCLVDTKLVLTTTGHPWGMQAYRPLNTGLTNLRILKKMKMMKERNIYPTTNRPQVFLPILV